MCSVATSCDHDGNKCACLFPGDAGSSNFDTVDCSGSTTNGASCAVVASPGFTGGSVVCDTSDGQYDVVPASGEYARVIKNTY